MHLMLFGFFFKYQYREQTHDYEVQRPFTHGLTENIYMKNIRKN